MKSGNSVRRRDVIEALEARTLFTSPPPTVVGAFVSGSEWSQPFKDYLAANVPYASAQDGLNVREHRYGAWGYLPWVNLDRITLSFNAVVTTDQADLTVRGVNVPNYPVVGFEYRSNPLVGSTATWILGRPLGNDRLLVRLDVDGPNGVRWDLGTKPIDGDGDYHSGGDYLLQLNVLPGDVNGDGLIARTESLPPRYRMFRDVTNPGMLPYGYTTSTDVDGSGRIDVLDVAHVRRRINDRLPTAQLTAGAEPLSGSSTSVFGTRRIRPGVRGVLAES